MWYKVVHFFAKVLFFEQITKFFSLLTLCMGMKW